MTKIGALALLGCLSGLLAVPAASRAADTPAFVNATMCDAAAPIAAGTAVFGRKIRAEMPAARRPAPLPQRHVQRQATRPHRHSASRAIPRPSQQAEAPASRDEAVLRPAVHFCVTPAGGDNPVRYT